MENKLSYIVDAVGNKTHVVIPYEDWIELRKLQRDNQPDIIKASDTFFASLHMSTVAMDKNHNFIQTTATIEIEQQYDCIKMFNNKDIALLYLMRNKQFTLLCYNAYKKELNEQENIDFSDFSNTLYEKYMITDEGGKPLSNEDASYFLGVLKNETDLLNLVANINCTFQFGEEGFKKRIRHDAEIKRLFFYDKQEKILSYQRSSKDTGYPSYLVKRVAQNANIKLNIPLKEQMEQLAIEVYQNNSEQSAITQMQKAIRDAEERVAGKWKDYVRK